MVILPIVKENKSLRCFIALDISREAIRKIEDVQNLIKKKNLFYGKFTEPENLHLTLKFLGEIEEEKVEEVKKKLSAIKFKEFKVSFGEAGVFSKKSLRMLWIKLNGKGIWDLQEEINEKLRDIFPKEERFMSHITIARMRNVPDRQEFLDYVKNMKIPRVDFDVKSFFLKKSELLPEGPIYSNLAEYKFDN